MTSLNIFTVYDDELPLDGMPGLTDSLRRKDRRERDRRAHESLTLEGGRRQEDPPMPPVDRLTGLAWELAKLVLPAALAFGGAWLSMHDQITDLRGDVKALSQQVNDIKTMLGIGVFQGKRP